MSCYLPGDFFVERSPGFGSALIRLGTRSRYNHAGIVVDTHGTTLEAMPQGAVWRTLERGHDDVVVVRPPLLYLERIDIQGAASKYGPTGLHPGVGYSHPGLIAIAAAQFGVRWPAAVKKHLADSGDLFCSQLVDQVLLDVGFHLYDDGRLPGDVSPGDLAELAFREDFRRVA